MLRGNWAFAFISIFAVSAVAGARTTARDRCNQLSVKYGSLMNQAQSLGYFSLSQPIVMAGDSTGLTEDQARTASQKKIGDFKAWLAGAQLVLNQSNADSNCTARQDAQMMISYGQSLLSNLLSFTGPYTQAQTKFSNSPAAIGDISTIELPCRPKGSERNGLRECPDVIRDVTSWTEGYLKNMIDAIYRGCDLTDSNTSTDPTSCQPKNQVQTCNYFAGLTGIANTSPEQGSNHIGKTCGQWISVGQRVSGSQCMISASSMGTMEQSFYQGNSIRALDCHWNQVKNDLAQGKLKLTAATGLDPAQKYATQIQLIKKAKEQLVAYKNIGDVEKCTADDLNSATAAKQSACMEYTHRLILEQHVAHMAAVEVIDRARRSFERFDAGTNGHAFFADFKSYLQQNQNTSQCRGKRSDCDSASSAYLTRCYKPLWQQFFESRSNSVWTTEVCQ